MEFEAFYLAYRGKLYGYLLRMTGQRELSLDVAQESFARCLERYGQIKNPVSLLFTIARNLVYDNHRRQKRLDGREAPEPRDLADPETALLEREETRRILSALQKLPETEREILSLTAARTLSYREIAKVMGISEANVKVRVHRARKSLRQILEEVS